MNLCKRKPLEDLLQLAQKRHLKQTLSALDITLLGLGVIIGTGIFVLTGIAAAQYAGPALILSFILAGITCAFVSLVYAELASSIPLSGSSYTYAYISLGEVFGWLVGWSIILEYTVGACAIAGGWSAYIVSILHSIGIEIPKALTMVPSDGGIVNLPAMLIVLCTTVLLIYGTKESATANKILVAVKIGTILLFLALAIPHINTANWEPFMPFGWHGVSAGAAVLFFAYLGFDALSTTAEEAKNPTRDLPIGIIASLLICTLLYMAVSAAMTGVVPYPQLDTAAPAAYVLQYAGMSFGSALVGTGAIAGLSTVLMVMIYAQTRSFYAMSRDGLIPAWLCTIHPKFGTPHIITAIVGTVVALVAGFTPIHIVAEMCSAGTIFAFLCSCVGALRLRKLYPNIPRGFRCPALSIVAPLGFFFCLYIMTNLSTHTLQLFAAWTVIGLLIYYFYGRKHSFLQRNIHSAEDMIQGK